VKHYEAFARGTLALSDLVYYPVLTALFLVLSIRRLDADRLRT
jgi:ABC-2 type transport system permease protein